MESAIEDGLNENIEVENMNLGISKAILDNKPTGEILRQISTYLEAGADIDAVDVNNNNNTPLHVAALTGNVKIFEFLLSRGANYNIPNNNNHTVTDIIEFHDTPNSKELSNAFYKKYGYTKRPGTSGLKGDLYETKLLCLILLRALHCTKEFILGTNVKEMGALDDIVLRYKTSNMQRSKIIILQTKHRENEKWSVEYILKLIYEYYESYLQIRQKLLTENNNILFKDSENYNIECEFIIYTSAKEYVTRNKNIRQSVIIEEQSTETENSLIKTSKNGKIFKFQYEKNYFDELVTRFTESRVKALGKTLAKLIIKDKLENFMAEDLMKTYHVFLAENVIKSFSKKSEMLFYKLLKHVSVVIVLRFFPPTLWFVFASALHTRFKNITDAEEINKGQFQLNFFTSVDSNITIMRHEIYKEIAKWKGLTFDHQQTEVENIIKSLTFKLPVNFGNRNWYLIKSEPQLQARLDHLYSLFQILFQIESYRDDKYIYIIIDDNSIGIIKEIQRKDVKLHLFGELVGNLLVHDNETDMLKINSNEECLCNAHKNIVQKLKNNYDLRIYRFDINIYGFPKLTLNNRKRDEKLVEDFLSHFKVYTDQSQEDEVEKIVKDEIDKLLEISHLKQRNQHIRDAIFLKMHDKILKWRLNTKSPYLTRFYNFYDEALRETFFSFSQLKNIHEICMKKIKATTIKFQNEAVLSLELDRLLNSNKRVMVIFTDEILFSSLKVSQYFTEIIQLDNYILINVDSANIENHLEILHKELEYAITPRCVIISILEDNIDHFRKTISVTETKRSKIIIIAHKTLKHKLNIDTDIICQIDKNNFGSFSNDICSMILEQRKMIFQGEQVIFNSVLNETSLNILSPNLLRMIVFDENIYIGKELASNLSIEPVNYYVDRSLYRCIKLNLSDRHDDLMIIEGNSNIKHLPQEAIDILLITEREDIFEHFCTPGSNINVHWFTGKGNFISHRRKLLLYPTKKNDYIWKQTQGSLEIILKYIDRKSYGTENEFTLKPKTLKDIQDKVVIISADSGMGKSTLLTNLAINTKRLYPKLWIVKINLLDTVVLEQLNYWCEHKIKIDLIEVMLFIYSQISDNKFYENHSVGTFITVNDVGEIHLNKYDANNDLYGIDKSEIELFNYFYNTGNLAILFDGFDEICPDYTKEVIQLLSILKTSKVAHLWITSRPYNVLEQLESALGTFAYSLNPLIKTEQRRYLQKVWHKKLGLEILADSVRLIDEFQSFIQTNLIIDTHFISFPLHLYMFAEIYLNDLKEFINLRKSSLLSNAIESIKVPTNMTIFYEKFMNKKFDIQFGEKNSSMSSKDPTVKKIIENKRKEFFDILKKLAAYYVLDKNFLLSKYDIEKVEEYIQNINCGAEKSGIFEWRIDNKANFIHKTFAEYLGVEFIFDKLRSDNCNDAIWKYLLDTVLRKNDIGIRTFINSKLENDQSIITYLRNNTEHMNTVFEILLNQLSSKNISALYLAIEADLEYIFLFLIECLKSVLILNKQKSIDFVQKINYACSKFCIFCLATKTRKESIVKCLKDFIITITGDKTNSNQNLALSVRNSQICVSLNSLTQDQGTVELIVEFLTDDHSICHWILGKYGCLTSFCFDYLLNFNEDQQLLFFNSDFEEQRPFQCVHKDNDEKNFDRAINSLFGKENTERMLTSGDYSNSRYTSLMLKNVLKEVFDKPHHLTDIDLKELVYNELIKLRSVDLNNTLNVSPPRQTFWQYISYGKQLYEIKMLNLILIRALCDDNIKDFIIAKHVTATFGQIIIRYKTNDTQETKMLFLHIIHSNKKRRIPKTFNFEKYLRDYLFIRQKFALASEYEIICKGSMKNIDCKFIIYNTASQKYIVNKLSLVKSRDQENIIETNKHDKPWQFKQYDKNIELLAPIIAKLRAIELAKTLSMYIISKNVSISMVTDELIRTYHVFLSQNVIEIVLKSDGYCKGRFRFDFLKSDEENIKHMRREICERIAYQNGLQQNDAERLILLYSFNLPVQFCQPYFGFYDNDIEQQDKIESICSTFKKIFEHVPNKDSNSEEYHIINLGDDSVGPDEIIQRIELVGKTGLAGLVGSLLITDELNTTGMLKFNLIETNLPPFDLSILQKLEKNYDLRRYRFIINVHGFPKLSLNCQEHDKKIAHDFLSKLRFYYTKDTFINKIEKTLKNAIHKNFTIAKKHHNTPFRVKCDAVFLNNLKYSIKYSGIYKNTIYSTSDLTSYAVPIPTKVRSKPSTRSRLLSTQNPAKKTGLRSRLKRQISRP